MIDFDGGFTYVRLYPLQLAKPATCLIICLGSMIRWMEKGWILPEPQQGITVYGELLQEDDFCFFAVYAL